MLIGSPGSGKTVTVAKLAARAVLNGAEAATITTDTRRAGAVEQLEAFTRLLKIELRAPRDAKTLATDIAALGAKDCLFIDSPGCNPFSDADIKHLEHLVEVTKSEPILVLAAGGDPEPPAAAAMASFGETDDRHQAGRDPSPRFYWPPRTRVDSVSRKVPSRLVATAYLMIRLRLPA